MQIYRYVSEPNRPELGFKVAVIAASKAKADAFIRREAISNTWYRRLQFAGEGMPKNPESWLAVKT